MKARRKVRVRRSTKRGIKSAIGKRKRARVKGVRRIPRKHRLSYNKAYDSGFDSAYNEGFNVGYAGGLEAGHQEAYKGE